MPQTIDYYIFLASPWAYLGSARFADLARAHNLVVNVRPMDAGTVFPASGGLPLAKRAPQRQAYRMTELKRWRSFLGLPLNLQPKFFPTAEAQAARMVVAAQLAGQEGALALAHGFMRAVWAEDADIAAPETQARVATACGLDAAALAQVAEREDVKAAYAANAEAALAAGVFGAPSYVLDGEVFWGQDRLDFLARALKD
ncbi:2-hydroxychromene-2-carboxylate isomerase [Ferrovibrio sp.]|uniref:2-hydroxychromene-2-carboxylate isomerase n=1 Tax=Ferrovibrio sp. TaxID=1917215 RepID=UPI0035AE1171